MGKSCNRSQECAHVNGAICTDRNVCDCAEATVINKDRKKCLRVAEDILEECEEDVQCTKSFPNALCVNRTCQCQSGYHFEYTEKQCYNNKSRYFSRIWLRFLKSSFPCTNSAIATFYRTWRALWKYVRLLPGGKWKCDGKGSDM